MKSRGNRALHQNNCKLRGEGARGRPFAQHAQDLGLDS